jgi:hypothetical protein
MAFRFWGMGGGDSHRILSATPNTPGGTVHGRSLSLCESNKETHIKVMLGLRRVAEGR